MRSRIRAALLNDGDPQASGAIIFRAAIPRADMPEDLQHAFPTLWCGPKSHIIFYPVRDWTLFNFAAIAVTGDERFDDEGGEVPAQEALALFDRFCDAPLRAMRAAGGFRRYVVRYREPVERWSAGRVTLLGDAAHPMVHYIAQGAATALEDAAGLVVAADEADGDFEAAFRIYERLRVARAGRVQLSSLMTDQVLHAEGPRRIIRNAIFEGRTDEEHYDRFAWLFNPPPYVSALANAGKAHP